MNKRTVKETHYILHDDYPWQALPMTVDVTYTVCDDGFVSADIDATTIDYEVWGSC